MSANEHYLQTPPAESTYWSRLRPILREFRAALIIVGLMAVLGAWATIEFNKTPSVNEQMAAIDARNAAYVSEFSEMYGATNVTYTGDTVTMNLGDKSYKCEAPHRDKLSEKQELRCEELIVLKPLEATN